MKKQVLIAAAASLAVLALAGQGVAQQPAAPGRGAAPAAPAATPPLEQNGPTIQLKSGKVQGGYFNGVAVWRGIPFASAPVGDLRWRAPKAPASWDGVRAATSFGGSCATVEDCLYLNVYTPPNASKGDNLPVMVWIHGGAFTGGSGSTYDGSTFAKQGVIVVTVNYRMGRAGWFAHPALTKENPNATANFGLMDQVAALKWVQANIGAFGGATKNVTIFGESAGAISVNYLMVDPNARGLFQKAISESGFGRLAAKPLKGAGSAEETGETWTKSLGITGSDAATAKKMRALTWEDLKKGPLPLGSVGPIADGHMITDTAVKEFAQGKQAKVPYILGGNSDEASLTRATTNVAARIQQVSTAKDAFSAAFDPDKTGANDRAVARLVTDELISEPDRALARIHTKAGQPTWVYHFSYVPMANRATAFGLAHGGEIPYVFGTPRGGGFDAEGTTVSKAANAYWLAFAKTGDPGSAGGPAWPKFDASSESLMEFGPQGSPHVQQHFHKSRLDFVEARAAK